VESTRQMTATSRRPGRRVVFMSVCPRAIADLKIADFAPGRSVLLYKRGKLDTLRVCPVISAENTASWKFRTASSMIFTNPARLSAPRNAVVARAEDNALYGSRSGLYPARIGVAGHDQPVGPRNRSKRC